MRTHRPRPGGLDDSVEFIGEEEADAREVTQSAGRPAAWAAAAVLVGVLVTALVISRGSDAPPKVASTTSVPAPAPSSGLPNQDPPSRSTVTELAATAATGNVNTPVGAGATPDEPASTEASAPRRTPPPVAITGGSVLTPLPLGQPTGLVLYLTPRGGAPTSVVAYDVDAAEFHRVDLGRDVGWYIRAVPAGDQVVIDAGEVMVAGTSGVAVVARTADGAYSDAPFGRVAPGPAGTVWVRTLEEDRPGIVQYEAGSGPTGGAFHELPRGADLYGSMADGRPVVRGADGRVFVVEPDDRRTLLAANALAPVDHGQFAEVRCDDRQACEVIGHLAAGEVPLGPPTVNGQRRSFRFQPDGPYVAVAVERTLVLLDTRTGTEISLVTRLGPEGYGSDDVLSAVRFLPDGHGLVVDTSTGLVLFDLDGTVVARLGSPSENPPAGGILGVGYARPWTS